MEWPANQPFPRCPSPQRMRGLYTLPPERIRALDDTDPTDDETGRGCMLVQSWHLHRETSVEDRRKAACSGCPLARGPRGTRLYGTAVRHLDLVEAGFSFSQSDYTRREVEAIRICWREREKCRAERIKKDG